MSENPNYEPNALSRFYQKIIGGGSKLWRNSSWLGENYLPFVSVYAVILFVFWVLLTYSFVGHVFSLLGKLGNATLPDEKQKIASALGISMTAVAALAAAPFFLIRVWVNERNAKTAEQGLITDRFTKAVEHLGAEKTVKLRERVVKYRLPDDRKGAKLHQATEIDGETFALPEGAEEREKGAWQSLERTVPNLEVRLGAIYALERIAQDSERDHIPIMETLCAYIRENSHWRAPAEHGLPEWVLLKEDASEEALKAHLERWRERFGYYHLQSQVWKWTRGLSTQRADVQTALTVIGRRPDARIAHERRQRRWNSGDDRGFQLDLRGANLQRADLSGLDLANALLTSTRLEGANLAGARLDGANLWRAPLEGAHLWRARLEGAYLQEAQLEGANLGRAHLVGANLGEVRLEGAYLKLARLEGANLGNARLEGANLREARLQGADLGGGQFDGADLGRANLKSAKISNWTCARTSLRSADFSDATGMTQQTINAAWGDSGTVLPKGIVMPDHWDDATIEVLEYDPDYQTWLNAGAPPGTPREPSGE